MLDYGNTGMSIMEHSHRGKTYDEVHQQATDLVRELLGVGEDYDVLFLQGGASLQFAMIPMNLLPADASADYIMTGAWSKKALAEASKIGTARSAGDTAVDGKFSRVPKQDELELDGKAAYVHITTNNTIFGTQYHELPDTGSVPLIADMSSDFLWKPMDASRFGMIYAGAQKNVGPSGLAIVVMRKSLIEGARADVPNILSYKIHSSKRSLYNTPNSFAIYMVRNVLEHLRDAGGLSQVEKHNRAKGELLYGAIDADADFFRCPVEKASRSLMNVVFRLPTEDLEKRFVAEAADKGMVGLKGHRSVGGIRASIYNAVSRQAVEALVEHMTAFRKTA